jgi:hypothetical protein
MKVQFTCPSCNLRGSVYAKDPPDKDTDLRVWMHNNARVKAVMVHDRVASKCSSESMKLVALSVGVRKE